VIAAAGGELLHHDGGTDVPGGLVSREDAALFPTDCVSDNAALALKRLCGQARKPHLARCLDDGVLSLPLGELQLVDGGVGNRGCHDGPADVELNGGRAGPLRDLDDLALQS
jgi:hypothetical protein